MLKRLLLVRSPIPRAVKTARTTAPCCGNQHQQHLSYCPSTTATPATTALAKAYFSSGGWNARGYDLTYDSLQHGDRPKVILQGYGSTGFDVLNTVKKLDEAEAVDSGTIHMHGSILVFPFGCFLWNVNTIQDITLESLAPVLLHRPSLEYLFVGSDSGDVNPVEWKRIQQALSKGNTTTVVEKMSLSNSMGTFNILNAEDRQVAVALLRNPHGDDEIDAL